MIMQLKKLYEIQREFEWESCDSPQGINVYHTEYAESYINAEMYKFFGRMIEVFPHEDRDDAYHYEHMENRSQKWLFHKDWFKPIEFFNKDEFTL